jgi:hypothetical protein
VGGSQTVQSTAGVLQAQVSGLTARARAVVTDRLPGNLSTRISSMPTSRVNGVNGISAQRR